MELYNVLVQARNATSKTKLDVWCKKFGIRVPSRVAKQLKTWVFLKPPTTYHQPTDHLPPITNQVHRPTDYWPIRNIRTRNSITTFKWISDKKIWDRVTIVLSPCCYKSNIENVSNYFLIKAGMCFWKDKIIKSEVN